MLSFNARHATSLRHTAHDTRLHSLIHQFDLSITLLSIKNFGHFSFGQKKAVIGSKSINKNYSVICQSANIFSVIWPIDCYR